LWIGITQLEDWHSTLPASADYLVKEVGSFHIGGRGAALSGMSAREVVLAPGSPALKVDPNGEFEVEQRLVLVPTGYRDALVAAGVKADVFALPAMGIKGNTHMMMMDKNSDHIAKLISEWLAKQGLMN
jgi:hypothetical protein